MYLIKIVCTGKTLDSDRKSRLLNHLTKFILEICRKLNTYITRFRKLLLDSKCGATYKFSKPCYLIYRKKTCFLFVQIFYLNLFKN